VVYVVCLWIHAVECSHSRGQQRHWLVGTASARLPFLDQRGNCSAPAPHRCLVFGPVALTHPRHGLDDLLGHPVRFSVVALLAPATQIEFSFVRDRVEVTDSMLSKQVSLLEQAGYVKVKKGFVGKRGRTWLSLTKAGRQVFERHMTALQEIATGESS
jgi:DNA-binding HxlR family transcriptional regulator